MSARWVVVTTSVEPVDILVAFARHHLSLGASEVHIFLDRPVQEDADRLALIPGVTAWSCDPSYWGGVHKMRRPKAVERRQLTNAHHVSVLTDVEWLIHLDSDEFIHSAGSVGQSLAAIPDGIDVVRLYPMERVYLGQTMPTHVFDGGFRLVSKHSPEATRHLLAAEIAAVGTYFLGHLSGKTFTRMASGLLMGIHRPRPKSGVGRRQMVEINAPHMGVLHFDGFTPLHWMTKINAYIERNFDGSRSSMQTGAQQFLRLVRQAGGDPRQLGKLFTVAKRIAPERADQLRRLGLLAELQDWRPLTEAADGGPDPDLSVAGFDRRANGADIAALEIVEEF